MEIILDKEKIFGKVGMSVSIVARDLKDAGGNSLYDKVRIQERDKDFLVSFYDKAVGELTASLCDFVIGKDGDCISIYLNDRTNAGLVNDVCLLSENFICNRISWEWMKVKAADYAEVFYSQSEDNMRLIREKLYYKNMPTERVMAAPERYCCCMDEGFHRDDKKVCKVILYKDVIVGDIDQELFSLYKRRKEGASVLMANDIEGHSQLSTYISKHAKRLNERVSAYLSSYRCKCAADNMEDRVPQYVYVLAMPYNWNCNHMEQLAEEMHTYVVNASLYDLLKPNYPEEALIFSGASDTAWDNVKHCVSVRKGGVNKPLQPF